MLHQGSACRAVERVDGRAGRCRLRRRDRVGIDIERRGLAEIADDRVAGGDVAAVDAERLAERADQEIGRRGPGDFLGAAAGASERADAVGIVDHHGDVSGNAESKVRANVMIRSSGAWSPRMLKIPSVTMMARALALAACLRRRSSSPMSR
jgi:hypothetical protein